MCLAVPLRVLRTEGAMAEVELGGVLRQVSIVLTPEATPGQYVLVHAGFAISVIDEEEAQATLSLLRELAEAGESLDEPDVSAASGAGNPGGRPATAGHALE